MVLGVRAFERLLGHKGKALKNGNSILIKEIPEHSFVPLSTR
jgi:hypothetical protein